MTMRCALSHSSFPAHHSAASAGASPDGGLLLLIEALSSANVTASSLPRRGRVGPKGRGGGSAAQLRLDHFKDSGQIPIDLVIPKSKHLKVLLLEVPVAHAITQRDATHVVLPTIHFNDQSPAQANEI